MILDDKYIDEWFIEFKDLRNLPSEFDYPTYYKNVANELNKWVHPFVNSGAMLNDNGYLTDHGPEHIKMLIKRISQFLNTDSKNDDLTPFEILILLLASHIHDVGNILGRNNHHINATEIIKKIGGGVALQHKVIWDYVYQIASAHKGYVIQDLNLEESYLEHEIRPQFLAAIIKFGDELSEDCTRADRYNTISGNISVNKPEAELYHQYALSLHSLKPDINSRVIKYFYQIDEEIAIRTFPKIVGGKTKRVYLLDEIYLRTLKAHYERLYCMRFMRPYINFDLIQVTIRIKLKNGHSIDKCYDLVEMGMEEPDIKGFYGFCPELEEFSGKKVREKIKNRTLN